MYLERIQRLERELATEKELCSSLTGSVPSHDAGGDKLHTSSASAEEVRKSVVKGSEGESVETRVTSPAAEVAPKVSGADLLASKPGESSGRVIVGSDKITGSSKGGAPLSGDVADKVSGSTVSDLTKPLVVMG